MAQISQAVVKARIYRDNPWWDDPSYALPEGELPRRIYFAPFKSLALNPEVRRAAVLLGPRRVGKTVMIKQLISEALADGFERGSILYASIDAPIYSGFSLEDFLALMPAGGTDSKKLVVFDEIQYLKDWEVHLKDLVDSFPGIKFVATGSAAAALKLKSKESGAGRFSDFLLPPLTFYEFLCFLQEDASLIETEMVDAKTGRRAFFVKDIDRLNARFVDYLNFGGYPEAVLNEEIRSNPDQFIKNDIIDKVLLKDLPSLYGISAIQELNKLFSYLAYNAGNEINLETICKESGVTKPTIKRYIEYLESAFLIMKVSMVDESCKSLLRERNFKVYLNNPSMRAALFAPVEASDSALIGHLTECAIFSQWQHSPNFSNLRYARWKNEGEVDIVYARGSQMEPLWIGEIKWSDLAGQRPEVEMKSMQVFLRKHRSVMEGFFTTKTFEGMHTLEGRQIRLLPSALHCYRVGRNITSKMESLNRLKLDA